MDTTTLEPGTDSDANDAAVRTSLIELDPREIVVNVRNPRERARKHVISDVTRRRDRKAAADRLRAELTLAGVKLIGRPKDFPYESKAARAEQLQDADGNSLDPNEMKARAGFAAFIDHDGYKPTATIVCLDPERMGYTRTTYTSYQSPEAIAEKERLARETAERAEALVAAREVRREFLKSTYRSAKSIKNLFVHALRDAVLDPHAIRAGETELFLAIAGGPALPDATKAGQDRLTRMLVAKWIVCNESDLTSPIFHGNHAKIVAYLDRLVTDGYTLSEAETELKTEIETALEAAAAKARKAQEEADEARDTDEEEAEADHEGDSADEPDND